MPKIEAMYGNMSGTLSSIASSMKNYDYAIIPEQVYQSWLQCESFRGEETDKIGRHNVTIAHFCENESSSYCASSSDDGICETEVPLEDADFSVVTCICPCPLTGLTPGRLIVKITNGDKVLAVGRLSIDDVLAHIEPQP